MFGLIFVFSIIFGLVIGSFLNFVVLRYGTGRMFDKRSQCFSCGKQLSFRELLPVLSFIVQKGRCLSCSSKISIQYPLVELVSGLLFGLICLAFYPNFWHIVFLLIIASVTIAVAVYDFRHKIIPNEPVVLLFILAIIFAIWGPNPFWLSLLSGAVLALFFFLLWYFSSGRLIGLGDAKLVLPLGIIVGVGVVWNFILFSFVSGAVFGLILIIANKFLLRQGAGSFTMKSELPFAPFLIFGFWLSIFFNVFNPIFF